MIKNKKNDVFGVIYITTCLINNKQYIGQTTQKGNDLNKYFGSGYNIKLSLKKYGRNNFTKEILCECSNKTELNNMEKFYIKEYNPKYNIHEGGTGGAYETDAYKYRYKKLRGQKRTEEQIENIRKSQQGKKLSEKHRNAISKGCIGKTGHKLTNEEIEHQRKIHLGQQCKNKGKNFDELYGDKANELKNQISNTLKEKYKNGYINPRIGAKQSNFNKVQSSKTHKGTIWINNIIKNKKIQPEELQEYIKSGWIKGMIYSRGSKFLQE